MSLSVSEQEIRCVQHWFKNWSETQRSKFGELLIQKQSDISLLESCFNSLNISSNCPSVFECQLRQFSLWFDNWSSKEKESLIVKLIEVDRSFVISLFRNSEP